MNDKSLPNSLEGVPLRILERFVEKLLAAEIDPETIERLKKTVLESESISDRAIHEALFPKDDPKQ